MLDIAQFGVNLKWIWLVGQHGELGEVGDLDKAYVYWEEV